MWTFNLAVYIESFERDEVPYVALKWKSDDNKDYYSVIVNPCGYVVLELIGGTMIDKW